jgi:hypothetical protein
MNLQQSETSLLADLREASITLAAYDAGGANVLEAFMRSNKLVPTHHEISGPATRIFGRTPEKLKEMPSTLPEILLASTGWQTDFEKRKIEESLSLPRRTIVFLDHWTNYQQRVMYKNELLSVSEIVTFDEKARNLARGFFPDSKIYLFPNYYMLEQANYVHQIRSSSTHLEFDYLFIGEPIRNRGYTEKDAIRTFIDALENHGVHRKRIAIRPHPSQISDIDFELEFNLPGLEIVITRGTALAQDLASAKNVVGCNSMALQLAHLCEIPTYCAIPEPFQSELDNQIFSKWNGL